MVWQPSLAAPIAEDRLLLLQNVLDQAYTEFRRLNDRLGETRTYAREAEGFSSEVLEQQMRLESIHVFDAGSHDDHVCPLCSSRLRQPVVSISAMQKSFHVLEDNLSAVSQERPKLREYINKLENRREEKRQEIKEIQKSIAAVQDEQNIASQIREVNTRIARVVGRVSLFVETIPFLDEHSELHKRVNEAQGRVKYLEGQIDDTESDEILVSILSSISADMTDWAKRLNLEFSGQPYRLDLNRLTVIVDRAGRPILMGQGLGGGENWLGCHLIAYLALHKYFIRQNRPVPGFIMLDQPTQVYFPPDRYRTMEGLPSELSDEDREAVERMFNFLFAVCKELAPELQIIVMDHAGLETPKFQKALVEKPWRGGNALVPQSWLLA